MTTAHRPLTPTEDLALEVLAARHRLGETLWTFEARHAATLRRLQDAGLVTLHHGTVERTVRASLTDAGRAAYLSPDYVPPALRPECASFYLPDTLAGLRVGCDRRRGHRKKHRHRWPAGIGLPPVTWTDADFDALVARHQAAAGR